MQSSQGQNSSNGPRLSTSSHSSVTTATNTLLNGLLSVHRQSQTATNIGSNQPINQLRNSRKTSQQSTRTDKTKFLLIILILTIILSLLFISTIQLTTRIFKHNSYTSLTQIFNQLSNLTINNTNSKNQTNSLRKYSIRAFFASVWFYNILLFFYCLFIHIILSRRRLRRNQTTSSCLREFIRIFDNGNSASNNRFLDYLMKICLLCFLWYFSCYLMFRSMSILISLEIVILYSITITLRQLLGWIFLHEQFVGNKIIAHILALSGFLFLAHDDGFRFNQFLLGLIIVTCAVGFKTTFDILLNAFIKDLNNSKLTIAILNVSFVGTCLSWPLILLFHWTGLEPFVYDYYLPWPWISLILFSSLTYTMLLVTVPFQYTSLSNAGSFLFIIPITAVIDHYSLMAKYSPLVISAILCALAGILLSMIPKHWFQASETSKMKQAFGLLNKDGTTSFSTTSTNTANLTSGTSSAFEEIRAQRRIRNALLYNDVKS